MFYLQDYEVSAFGKCNGTKINIGISVDLKTYPTILGGFSLLRIKMLLFDLAVLILHVPFMITNRSECEWYEQIH